MNYYDELESEGLCLKWGNRGYRIWLNKKQIKVILGLLSAEVAMLEDYDGSCKEIMTEITQQFIDQDVRHDVVDEKHGRGGW